MCICVCAYVCVFFVSKAERFSCGMWGVIAAGLFAVKNRIRDVTGGEPGGEYGLFWGGGFEQLGIQVVGLLAIIGWSAAFAAVTFGLMRLIGWYAFVENSWTIPLA